jgi:hypothetical protein
MRREAGVAPVVLALPVRRTESLLQPDHLKRLLMPRCRPFLGERCGKRGAVETASMGGSGGVLGTSEIVKLSNEAVERCKQPRNSPARVREKSAHDDCGGRGRRRVPWLKAAQAGNQRATGYRCIGREALEESTKDEGDRGVVEKGRRVGDSRRATLCRSLPTEMEEGRRVSMRGEPEERTKCRTRVVVCEGRVAMRKGRM